MAVTADTTKAATTPKEAPLWKRTLGLAARSGNPVATSVAQQDDYRDAKFNDLFPDGLDSPPELERLYDAAKFQVDFQTKMADRLDAKARGLATLTSAFVAAVTALASRPLTGTKFSDHPALFIGTALMLALLCLALGITGRSVLLQAEGELMPDKMRGQLTPALKRDKRVPAELAQWHINLAALKKTANDERARRMKAAELSCMATIICSGIVALLALFAL